MARQSLEDWMQEMATDLEKGRCTAFALVHMLGTVEEEIYVKKLPDKLDAAIIRDLAEMFQNKADTYAQGVPGAQTFCLQAFYDNQARSSGKYPFVRAGYTELDGLMTEKGFMQQMMRHNEGIISRGIQKDQVLFEAMARMMEVTARQAESLKRENIENFGFIKELILQLNTQQHGQRLTEIEAQSSANMKAELTKWVPQLVNAATGRDIIPQSFADTQIVEGIIDALGSAGPEALPLLQKLNMPAPLMASISHRFQQGMAARAHEQKTRKTVDESDAEIDGGLQ